MKHFFAGLLFFAATLTAAPITYLVTVDTSSFNGQNARADFQFNPGGLPDLAVAVTDGLSGIGSFSEVSRAGDVTGSGPWTFGNGQPVNQLVLNLITLSNSFSFFVTFSGDAIDNPSSFDATSFFFTMLNPAGSAPLTGFSAPSLWLDVSQGSSFVTSQDRQITVSDVPEPGTLSLVAAVAVFALFRRNRQG